MSLKKMFMRCKSREDNSRDCLEQFNNWRLDYSAFFLQHTKKTIISESSDIARVTDLSCFRLTEDLISATSAIMESM